MEVNPCFKKNLCGALSVPTSSIMSENMRIKTISSPPFNRKVLFCLILCALLSLCQNNITLSADCNENKTILCRLRLFRRVIRYYKCVLINKIKPLGFDLLIPSFIAYSLYTKCEFRIATTLLPSHHINIHILIITRFVSRWVWDNYDGI